MPVSGTFLAISRLQRTQMPASRWLKSLALEGLDEQPGIFGDDRRCNMCSHPPRTIAF
jgi:hypothetical protein